MNKQIQEIFIADLKRFPKYLEKFEKFVLDSKIEDLNQIVFINDPEAFKFLKFKMYVRKGENNENELSNNQLFIDSNSSLES